jgi:hypothetical protein
MASFVPRRLFMVLAAAAGLHCAPNVFVAGSGGESTSSTSVGPVSSSSGQGGNGGESTSSSAPCLVLPPGAAIPALETADAQGNWSDPSLGLNGRLFLDPATAGSFSVSSQIGAQVKYTQQQAQPGDVSGDPSFGVRFSSCVDASQSLAISFSVGSFITQPAGTGFQMAVLTRSTTPAPYGTCVPTGPSDCVAPTGPTDEGTEYPSYTWDQISGGSPAQTGSEIAKEIVGIRWSVDSWEGPPSQVVSLDYVVGYLTFSP